MNTIKKHKNSVGSIIYIWTHNDTVFTLVIQLHFTCFVDESIKLKPYIIVWVLVGLSG